MQWMGYNRRMGKENRNVRLRLSARQQHETTYKKGGKRKRKKKVK
jgi:hypothetical protein